MNKINKYINAINRVEFAITHSCTSNCKHCSVGIDKGSDKLDKYKAANVLIELSKEFQIESVMTFGGEPLLFYDTAFTIHKTAKDCRIPVRQIITNGYFTNDNEKIRNCAIRLEESGINDVLLSIDCFHQEYIPVDKVYEFAKCLNKVYKGRIRLQPAWLVNEQHDNPYNRKTKEYLAYFNDIEMECSSGNNIFPAGNAIIYLADYFTKKPIDINFKCGDAPYTEDLECISGITINPNGDVVVCSFTIGNINKNDILDILDNYNPRENPYSNALISYGIKGLIEYVEESEGKIIDISKYYSPCHICRDIVRELS